MDEPRSQPLQAIAYQIVTLSYAFIIALAVILLRPLPAATAFLSLQCMVLLFTVPIFFSFRPGGHSWTARLRSLGVRLLRPAGLIAAGAAAALLASFVTPVGVGRILLCCVFALTFGLLLAGLCSVLLRFLNALIAQVCTLAVGLLMVSTPYYINPFILAASGPARMRIAQLAVSINPLLVGARGILGFDWLRSDHLYNTCLIGGWQFPYYYPPALRVGILMAVAGIILMVASALKRAGEGEKG